MTAKPIRLLIPDIDGPLVRRDKTLSPETVAAVQRLTESGMAMSLISARPISGILPQAEQLALTGPFGAFNGGTLCDLNGVIGAPPGSPAPPSQSPWPRPRPHRRPLDHRLQPGQRRRPSHRPPDANASGPHFLT